MFGGFCDSTGKSILDSLEAVYLGGVNVQEKRVAIVKFSVYYRCSNCGSGLEVEYRADSAEITDVHETRAGKMGDVIGEAEVLVKDHT